MAYKNLKCTRQHARDVKKNLIIVLIKGVCQVSWEKLILNAIKRYVANNSKLSLRLRVPLLPRSLTVTVIRHQGALFPLSKVRQRAVLMLMISKKSRAPWPLEEMKNWTKRNMRIDQSSRLNNKINLKLQSKTKKKGWAIRKIFSILARNKPMAIWLSFNSNAPMAVRMSYRYVTTVLIDKRRDSLSVQTWYIIL